MDLMRGCSLILISLSFIIQMVSASYNHSLEEELRTSIFTTKAYNRFIRPDTKVNVSVEIVLYTLNDLNIKDETMECTMFFKLEWTDDRFNWQNNTQYSSINKIYTSEEYAWVPKIAILNSVKDLTVLGDHEILVLVYSNGRVFWPPGTFDKTICHCDVTYFPFDTQTCDILLTTWTYGKDDILLLFDSKPIEMGFFLSNGEWEYRKYSTAILDSFWNGVAVRQLKYSFTFRRRPLFHVLISLIPLTLLSFISVITFRLPVESGERIGFCLTNLLAFALYLTLVATYIPTTSYTTSFLSMYLLVLSICVLSIFETAYVLSCHNNACNKPVPNWVTKVTENLMMPLMSKNDKNCYSFRCCQRQHKTDTVEDNDLPVEKKMQKNMQVANDKTQDTEMENGTTWIKVARCIDDFCFYSSIFTTVILTVFMYILLFYGYCKEY